MKYVIYGCMAVWIAMILLAAWTAFDSFRFAWWQRRQRKQLAKAIVRIRQMDRVNRDMRRENRIKGEIFQKLEREVGELDARSKEITAFNLQRNHH